MPCRRPTAPTIPPVKFSEAIPCLALIPRKHKPLVLFLTDTRVMIVSAESIASPSSSDLNYRQDRHTPKLCKLCKYPSNSAAERRTGTSQFSSMEYIVRLPEPSSARLMFARLAVTAANLACGRRARDAAVSTGLMRLHARQMNASHAASLLVRARTEGRSGPAWFNPVISIRASLFPLSYQKDPRSPIVHF